MSYDKTLFFGRRGEGRGGYMENENEIKDENQPCYFYYQGAR